MNRSETRRTTSVTVGTGRAVLLRQRALSSDPADEPGWDLVRVSVRDVGDLAHEVAGYGPDVVALEPADLRAGVVEKGLRAVPQGGEVRGSVLPAPEVLAENVRREAGQERHLLGLAQERGAVGEARGHSRRVGRVVVPGPVVKVVEIGSHGKKRGVA